MDRLKDKIVLITGAAGSIGKAVAEAVERRGRALPSPAICRAARARPCARRHLGAGLAARDRRDRPHARPARRPGQCRRHRRARQHRGDRFRHLAAGHGGQSRRHVSRLQARPGAAQAARRLRSSISRRSRAWSAGTTSPPTTPRRAACGCLPNRSRCTARGSIRRCAATRSIRPFSKARWSTLMLQADELSRRRPGADHARHSARPARHRGRSRRHVRLSAVGRIPLRHRRRIRHRRRPDRAVTYASCGG